MRFEKLDILRGLAIVLMLLFHLNYSLVHILGEEFLNFSELFWYILGKISALGFIIIAGFSYFLAEKKYGTNIWKRYIKYALILAFLAGGISLGTYIYFSEQFIVFGILHFFALSFLLLPWVTKLGYGVFFLGLSIIVYGVFFIPLVQNPFLFPLGFRTADFFSADYYPLFPYFGVLLLGYSLALVGEKFQKFDILQSKGKENILEKFLSLAGKNSLLIYLLHQPIIIGILFLVKWLGKQ